MRLVEPDPNDRECVSCRLTFTPYSMTWDDKPVILPPSRYLCMSCRILHRAKAA